MNLLKLNIILLILIITKKSYSQYVLSYFPKTDSYAGYVIVKGDTAYIGGSFTSIGGLSRTNLAAVNMRTGLVLPFINNSFTDPVVFLLYNQNKLYFVGGNSSNLGSIDLTTGNITNWCPRLTYKGTTGNPSGTGKLTSIAVYNNKIFMSGAFDSINGVYKKGFAIVDAINGSLDNSYSDLESTIVALEQDKYHGIGPTTIAIKDSIFYFGGVFFYNINTGQKTSWNPNPDNSLIKTFAFGTNTIYVGGGFSFIGNQLRNSIAELDLINGNATSWNPLNNITSNGVYCIGHAKTTVYISNLSTTDYLESYDKVTGAKIDTWALGTSVISAMASYGDTIIVCGFGKLNGVNYGGLAALTRGISSGVNEVNNTLQKISVFPNPATNKISFSLNETNNKTLNIIITNILGETVFNNTLNYQKEIEIPVTDLNNGLYFIKIQSGNNTYASMFVKE